jgi:hypothetical protein
MAIGLDATRLNPWGRGATLVRASLPTVREVCLLGIDDCGSGWVWTIGQTITWLGRGYQVVATAARPAELVKEAATSAARRRFSGSRGLTAAERYYVHLTATERG